MSNLAPTNIIIDAGSRDENHCDHRRRTVKKALEAAAPSMDKVDLFREAIKTFVRVQAVKRLVALGAAAPDMTDVSGQRLELLQ